MIEIRFPQQIRTHSEGYAVLSKCMEPMITAAQGEVVILDFTNLSWLDANLLTIIGVCIEEKKNYLNIKYRGKIKVSIQNIWQKNGFGKYFGLSSKSDTYNSVLPYKTFNGIDGKIFGKYIDDVLLTKKKLPGMSSALKKLISNNIQEIFGNAPMHGNCTKVVSCGQIYFSTNQLMFTIVNLGNTIKQNVRYYFETYLKKEPPSNAIEWAVIEDNSTKQIVNRKSGGKGLALLNEFITKNKGEIHICSDNEYWQTGKTGTSANNMYSCFPGTIVSIVINLNDTKSYILSSEINNVYDNLF
jgi:hypothetical protein